MSIHQVSITYQQEQDRILMRLRTHGNDLYELWFTRRMMSRLLAPLQQMVARLAIQNASGNATVVPEAQQMVLDTAREKSRQEADFKTPFRDEEAKRPLGEQPMLVTGADLQLQPNRSLKLALGDPAGRNLAIELTDSLANNVLTLLMGALQHAEWGFQLSPTAAQTAPAPQARMLN